MILASGAVGSHRREPLFAPIVFLHIGLTMLLLLLIGMRIWPRFFFLDIGFLMLLIVLGVQVWSGLLARLAGGRIAAGTVFGVGVAAMILISLPLAVRNYTQPKQDLAGAMALVEAERDSGDRVYGVGVVDVMFQGYFETDWGAIRTDEELAAALAEPGPVWLVLSFPSRTFRDIAGLEAAVDAEFEMKAALPGSLGDGVVVVFKRG